MLNIGKQNKEENTDPKPILPQNAVDWANAFQVKISIIYPQIQIVW